MDLLPGGVRTSTAGRGCCVVLLKASAWVAKSGERGPRDEQAGVPWMGVGGGWAFPSSEHFPGGQGPALPDSSVPSERWSLSLGTERGPWGAERRTQQRRACLGWGCAPEEPRHREGGGCGLRGQTQGGEPSARGGPQQGWGGPASPLPSGSLAPPQPATQARGAFGSAAGGEGVP